MRKKLRKHHLRQEMKTTFFFTWRNFKGKKGRTFLTIGLFLVMSAVSFLMIGQIWVYRDDRITKEYDSSAYLQENDTRLSARKSDNSVLTEEDKKNIQNLKYVETVDLYDYANDVRYTVGKDDKTKKKENDFMKSSTCLEQIDLAEGRLPKSRLEIVLYDKAGSALGKKITCSFSSENLWVNQTCQQTLTVVGLLKEPSTQVYFHPQLCRMLTVGVDGYQYQMKYCKDAWQENYYHYTRNFYPLIADDLKENQVRVSKNYILPETDPKNGSLEQLTVKTAFCGESLPIYVTKQLEDNTMEQEVAGHFLKDDELEGYEDDETAPFDKVNVQMDLCDQGGGFVEVSQELFDRIYGEETTQASVYITSYGKTDDVLKELQNAGYDAISTYRVSTTKYVEKKVYQRLELLCLCSGVLLALAVLEMLLLRFLLRLSGTERKLLRFMGLAQRQVKQLDYQELGLPCFCLSVLTLLVIYMGGGKISFLNNMLQYETGFSILLYFVYNVAVMLLSVVMFHQKGQEGDKQYD